MCIAKLNRTQIRLTVVSIENKYLSLITTSLQSVHIDLDLIPVQNLCPVFICIMLQSDYSHSLVYYLMYSSTFISPGPAAAALIL